MAAISLFLPYVRTIAENCPDIVITQQAQHTIADFCERSLALKTDSLVDLVGGTADYNVTPPDGTQVVKILYVYVDGKKIDPTSIEELDDGVTDWRTRSGTPFGYIQSSHEDIQLIYSPDQSVTQGVRFHYAYRPDIATTEFPDMLYERWFEGILAGIKSRVLGISGKAWSDPGQSAFYREMFEQAIGAAAAMGAKQFGAAPLRVRPCP